jgi:hypothetical protein
MIIIQIAEKLIEDKRGSTDCAEIPVHVRKGPGFEPGGFAVGRLIKDYVQVGDHASLDDLIERLTVIRDSLPATAEAEIRVRGDDHYGRHLCVAYFRPLTVEEAACEGRYCRVGERKLKAAA